MRVVSGGNWTLDGRWVVVAEWHGGERIVYDPDSIDPLADLWDCIDFARKPLTTGKN